MDDATASQRIPRSIQIPSMPFWGSNGCQIRIVKVVC
jgi:hypothetical protein